MLGGASYQPALHPQSSHPPGPDQLWAVQTWASPGLWPRVPPKSVSSIALLVMDLCSGLSRCRGDPKGRIEASQHRRRPGLLVSSDVTGKRGCFGDHCFTARP